MQLIVSLNDGGVVVKAQVLVIAAPQISGESVIVGGDFGTTVAGAGAGAGLVAGAGIGARTGAGMNDGIFDGEGVDEIVEFEFEEAE